MTRSVAARTASQRLLALRARAMSADDLAFGWPWQNCGKLLVSYNASYISALRLVWDATQQYRRLWRRVGALSTTRGAAHRAFFVSQRPVKSPSQFVITRSCVLVESLHTIAACCRRPISNCRRAACSQQQISRGALKSCRHAIAATCTRPAPHARTHQEALRGNSCQYGRFTQTDEGPALATAEDGRAPRGRRPRALPRDGRDRGVEPQVARPYSNYSLKQPTRGGKIERRLGTQPSPPRGKIE